MNATLTNVEKEKLLGYLTGFISENKKHKFYQIIQNRTRHLTVVLEDIFQSQNASAVLRTCDCLGIQDVHIIENRNEYTLNPDVVLGASKWLSIFNYNEKENNTKDCITDLKRKGFQIVATSPHKDGYDLFNLPINKKTALLFGTELNGLSEEALELADEYIKIPMFGFTESYNISVSAAIVLFQLSDRLRKSTIDWEIDKNEKTEILLNWCRSVIKAAEGIESEYLKNMKRLS